MTPSPTDDELDAIFMVLEKYKENIKFLHHTIKDNDLTPDEILSKEDAYTNEANKAIQAHIDRKCMEARMAELNDWFNMPRHYPGEEYRDKPFAEVKCKTPDKITYYTLDSSFTYALINRINQLKNQSKKEL